MFHGNEGHWGNAVWNRLFLTVGLFFMGLPLSHASGVVTDHRVTHGLAAIDPLARTTETLRGLPLSFEANDGRTDPQVDFIARGRGYAVFLTPREAVLTLRGSATSSDGHGSAPSSTAALRVQLEGANAHPRGAGLEKLPGRVNYLLGDDPAQWRTTIPTWARVRYREVYPGIDLVYYGKQGQLEYDFVVRPGADPGRIILGFEGAEKVGVDAKGDLLLQLTSGAIRHRKPVIYQEVDGARREIGGGYVRKGAHAVGFEVAAYDRRRPVVIDPVLFYSTYLGGADSEEGGGIAVDTGGYVYVSGRTPSIDFPATTGAFRTASAGLTDVFVAKLDPAGSALVYSTYLGGAGSDHGNAVAVDAAGNTYVTGETQSTDFPTTPGAFQPTPPARLSNTTFVAFVAKLNPTGSALVYSTYLGGGADGQAAGIAVDASGYAYVSGTTSANDFPTTLGAFQRTRNGQTDAVVVKLNATGSALVYSTYLGGGSTEHGEGIAIDADGNAYLTGRTSSGDFPTTPGAFQRTKASGPSSHAAFATKLNPAGSALVYSTYLAGTGSDRGVAIAIDVPSNPNAYVTGRVASTDFPTTPGAFQTTKTSTSSHAAFVTKLDPTGSALVYSTYLGGTGDDEGTAVAADTSGSAYVIGEASSTDFPTTANALQATLAGPTDAFVTKLDPSGSALAYSTYLGGAGDETSTGLAIDAFGSAYVTGVTTSTDFPTIAGAFDTTFNGIQDGFVVKIADFGPAATLALEPAAATSVVNTQYCVTATVSDSASRPVAGVTVRFTVTGAMTTAGSARTDATGQATFCYMGPSTPGSDSIAAFADTNNSGAQDPGEPGDTATKTWVQP
jgi:hypothetical protein